MSQTEVQLIKDAVIVNADVSNSAAIDVSKLSGVMPLAGGTFTDDVTFTGASANIVFDKSDNALEFADSASAKFGADGDLEIKHNNDNSFINDTGTGQLMIQASALRLRNYPEGHTQVRCSDDVVELYFDNSKKFETTAAGGQFTGTEIKGPDNCKFVAGTSGDADFYHDGSATYLRNATGNLHIRSDNNIEFQPYSGDEVYAKFINDGAVELYHNNSKKFETSSVGATLVGNLTLDAEINLAGGSDAARFIDSQLGDGNALHLRGTTGGDAGHENLATFTRGGSAELYFDASAKLRTKTSGVVVSGSQLSLDDSNACIFFNTSSSGFGPNIGIGRAATNNFHVTGSQVGDLVLAAEYEERIIFGLTTNTSGAPTIKMTMNPGGQIDGDFNDTSDANLKENIKLISDNAIADIKKLKPVTFDWKETKGNNNVSGFIAQEVKEVIPNLINGKEWSEEDQSSRYTINTIGVVAHVTKALQEAITKIETLETKVAALEAA